MRTDVVMVQLCHSNDFGSLQLCSPFAIRVLALLCASPLVRKRMRTNGRQGARINVIPCQQNETTAHQYEHGDWHVELTHLCRETSGARVFLQEKTVSSTRNQNTTEK
jgi:hypothetical protein